MNTVDNQLLLGFYGDDFTGSTDALESLVLSGIRTVLFTAPPSQAQLRAYPGLQAFGVAGQSRAMTPQEMEEHLRPALTAMRDTNAAIVHYKVCSTFDSSPGIGNIGKVIELGSEVFSVQTVPIVVGAPALGRYCVFGNLFARSGAASAPFRLDRHPSMSGHPVTPMDEADLRVHLSRQTNRSIQLLDVTTLDQPDATVRYGRLLDESPGAILIDLLNESQQPVVGQMLEDERTRFVVGSSGVESSLAARWMMDGNIAAPPGFESVKEAGAIMVLCGSCSPVTARQIQHAVVNGFARVSIDVHRLLENALRFPIQDQVQAVTSALRTGTSVIIDTGGRSEGIDAAQRNRLGAALGEIALHVLKEHPIKRLAVAGGDTSGQIARVLQLESMQMIGQLTRGAPLCRVRAPQSPADGMEITFKGGQIGSDDFFSIVRSGG